MEHLAFGMVLSEKIDTQRCRRGGDPQRRRHFHQLPKVADIAPAMAWFTSRRSSCPPTPPEPPTVHQARPRLSRRTVHGVRRRRLLALARAMTARTAPARRHPPSKCDLSDGWRIKDVTVTSHLHQRRSTAERRGARHDHSTHPRAIEYGGGHHRQHDFPEAGSRPGRLSGEGPFTVATRTMWTRAGRTCLPCLDIFLYHVVDHGFSTDLKWSQAEVRFHRVRRQHLHQRRPSHSRRHRRTMAWCMSSMRCSFLPPRAMHPVVAERARFGIPFHRPALPKIAMAT